MYFSHQGSSLMSRLELRDSLRRSCKFVLREMFMYLVSATRFSLKVAVFWVVAPCSQVYLLQIYQTTRCYKPLDRHLHTHRRENLKSYLVW
jgi:hypothetical protein